MARCSLENINDIDYLRGYVYTDESWGKTIDYFGWVNSEAQWVILRDSYNTITGVSSYRYAKGDTNYPTNWTNRASLTYDYYDVVF